MKQKIIISINEELSSNAKKLKQKKRDNNSMKSKSTEKSYKQLIV